MIFDVVELAGGAAIGDGVLEFVIGQDSPTVRRPIQGGGVLGFQALLP